MGKKVDTKFVGAFMVFHQMICDGRHVCIIQKTYRKVVKISKFSGYIVSY